ncbi:MAG: outer membrane protein assembly factor BamB [Gammaproteobacteria bacterium]|nr:outer membrane protein assembly factor BamB [Gammaproteobacteria bacterium]
MKQVIRIAGLLAAASLVAGCGLFDDKDDELEPMKLTGIDETVKIKRIWSADLGAGAEHLRVALRPTGDGSRIYAAGHAGNVAAFDPASGERIWQTDLGQQLTAGPGVGEGAVAVTSRDGFIILLDASDGSERWRVDVEAESLARPLVKGETVIVQTIDNRLEAFSVFDGRSRWSLQRSAPALTVRGSSSPVAIGKVAFAGFDSGRLVAVDIDTGAVVWDTLLSPPQGRSDLDRLSDIDGELAVVGQDLYASGYNGRLAAIAAESGQVLWSREISSLAGVAADWNNLYSVRDDGEIVALDRRNGAETWRQSSLLRREPTLAVPFGSTVVVGDLEGYIHFFSTLDGEPVARKQLGGKAISADPYVIANRLYIQSDSGDLGVYVIVDERPQRAQPDIADES